MKAYIYLIPCFLVQISFGQTPYKINYSEPTTLKVNNERQDRNETYYDVEFLNSNKQTIKSISRTQEDNHSSKTGYDINNSISYYFYQNSLLVQEISIDPDYNVLRKTDYTYNENKKNTGWINYSNKPKISKDSFRAIIEKDLLLNDPHLFPTKNLVLETKEVKQYENNKIVYECYYERYGKLKTAIPAREQFFKYNDKGQLVEHLSNPKSDAGGSAFLRNTYEYNNSNQVTVEESYSDGRHQGTAEFGYTDSTIVRTTYILDDNGKKRYYLQNGIKEPDTIKTVYTKGEDGKFYDQYGSRFVLTGLSE